MVAGWGEGFLMTLFFGKAFISALFLTTTNLANSTKYRNIAAMDAHGYVY